MKPGIIKVVLFVFASALMGVGCKKKFIGDSTSPNKDSDLLTSVMNENSPKYQSFSVDAATGGRVSTPNGSIYFIPANAFVDSNDEELSGNVTLYIKELINPSDIVFADKPTVTSDGRILQSYGVFHVTALQGNRTVKLKKDTAIQVRIMGKPSIGQGIPLWGGDSIIHESASGYDYQNNFVTVLSALPINKGMTWQQLTGQFAFANSNSTLSFKLDSLNRWTNCDVFVNDTRPKTTVFCYFKDHYNTATNNSRGNGPTTVYFKPRNINSVVKLYDVILTPPSGKEGFYSLQNSIPIGLEGTFLAISVVNGSFFAELKDVVIPTPEPGRSFVSFTFYLEEHTKDQIQEKVRQLNFR